VRALAVAFPFVAGGGVGWEEQLLVTRLKAHDADALGEAYDAHHVHVRAFAARLLGDASAAEDLVQETFLTLPRAIARFRGESSLRTFLIAIATRHAGHHVRAAARRRAAMTRMGREPTAPSVTPEDEAARQRLAAALTRALDALPVDQRVAVVLCEVEGRTSAEAARIVDAPEGTVRTRLMHARRKLAELLAKEGVS
jgi:RNA polymerase sigma-70 factor (ECF subfamily)